MPRVAASNGVRPEIRALGVITLNQPVTPSEINAHVGVGDYAAKYISFLKTKYGFDFTVQKDGRKIVSYTLIKEPSNADELRATTPPVKTVKAAPGPKGQKINVPTAKRPDATAKQFGTTGEVSAYGIDPDFDSTEGEDLSKQVA